MNRDNSTLIATGSVRAGPLLGMVLFLTALNLRGAMTAMGPVLPEIMQDTGLSASFAGLLTTVPVLCLSLLAPVTPALARRLGTDRAVLVLLLILALGCALRWFGTAPALLVSGMLIGGPIGMINVLLPGIVKRDFPSRMALMTGLYTMALCVSAAIGSGLTVPLARALGGWGPALALWAIPALIAAAVLLPLLPDHATASAGRGLTVRGLWRDRLAWEVALFFGAQSAFTYILFAWLPPLLRERGMDPVSAGLVSSVASLVQMAASLAAPLLAVRFRDQRLVGVLSFAIALVGVLGCLWLPLGWTWASAGLMGIGQGATFAVVLTLVVLRSPDATVAAHLSSMSQTVAYLMAAAGPALVGLLHDQFGGWGMMTPLMMFITVVGMIAAAGAGRNRFVNVRAQAIVPAPNLEAPLA
jgi:CP family cyanate transporter-like MFS transporter